MSSRRLACCLLCCLPAAAAFGESPQISSEHPIINFSTSTWTPDGHRSWLLRATEALPRGSDIQVKGLTLTIFSPRQEDKVDTMILSPDALVQPDAGIVSGPNSIRVLTDDYEASGSDWRYSRTENRITIARKVRVVFHSELKDLLQ